MELTVLLATIGVVISVLAILVWLTSTSPTNISGEHVLITGGSSGIGKAVAIEAVKLGAHVSILARNKTNLEAALADMKKYVVNTNQKLTSLSLDVANASFEDIKTEMADLQKKSGQIKVLINCAGFSIPSRADQISMADVRRMMEVNYYGSVGVTQALLPDLKAQRDSAIIFTSSLAGLAGVYGLSAYCGTKFAIRGYAEALAMGKDSHYYQFFKLHFAVSEVAPYGIKVSVNCPPDTATPGFEEENKTKPEETKLISEGAGLFQPEQVAKILLEDGLRGKFLTSNGLDGWMLTTLTAGMGPSSVLELISHVFLIGPLRLVAWGYLQYFAFLINKCKSARDSNKKSN